MMIYKERVLCYSESRKMLKHFAEQCNLEKYKIKKIDDEWIKGLEEQIYDKELYYDEYYGLYVTSDMLLDMSMIAEEIADSFIRIDNFMDLVIEYVKFTKDESEDIMMLCNEIHEALNDVVGIDESSGPAALYSDYFNMVEILRELVEGTTKISRAPF